LYGNVDVGSAGLQALIGITDNRVNDRTNGVICRPGSLSHPQEIAAEAMAYCASVNSTVPAKPYVAAVLSGVDIGYISSRTSGNDWTRDYTNRDLAVKAGISPTTIEGGSVLLQNVVSHFRPSNIPAASNGYREFAHISIIQNILYNYKLLFGSIQWQAFNVVSNITNVTDMAARGNMKDANSVRSALFQLITQFANMGWIYSPEPSYEYLPQAVSVRASGNGFDTTMQYILAGIGNIINSTVYLDASVAAAS
jgi:hypothetical protein